MRTVLQVLDSFFSSSEDVSVDSSVRWLRSQVKRVSHAVHMYGKLQSTWWRSSCVESLECRTWSARGKQERHSSQLTWETAEYESRLSGENERSTQSWCQKPDQDMKPVIREGIGEARRDQRRHGEMTAQVQKLQQERGAAAMTAVRAPVHNEIPGHRTERSHKSSVERGRNGKSGTASAAATGISTRGQKSGIHHKE